MLSHITNVVSIKDVPEIWITLAPLSKYKVSPALEIACRTAARPQRLHTPFSSYSLAYHFTHNTPTVLTTWSTSSYLPTYHNFPRVISGHGDNVLGHGPCCQHPDAILWRRFAHEAETCCPHNHMGRGRKDARAVAHTPIGHPVATREAPRCLQTGQPPRGCRRGELTTTRSGQTFNN